MDYGLLIGIRFNKVGNLLRISGHYTDMDIKTPKNHLSPPLIFSEDGEEVEEKNVSWYPQLQRVLIIDA